MRIYSRIVRMTFALVHSRALRGLDSPAVTVEVHLANGLPSFTLVGLADTEVKESRERVRAALQTSGLEFPHNKRVTVSLAPADLPKESGRFDLPIALGILAAAGQIDAARLDALRVRRRALARPASCGRCTARWRWRSRCDGRRRRRRAPSSCREASADESALVDDLSVRGADHLLDVVRALLPGADADASGLHCASSPAAPGDADPPRSRRRPRPERRQARPRDRRGRAAERADGRPAGHRQVDAGAPSRRPAAAAVARRSARVGGDPERRRRLQRGALGRARPARAASHGVGRGAGRRRLAAAPRRSRRSPTTASSSSTSSPSSRAPPSRRCASRSRPVASSSRGRRGKPTSRPRSSSSRR